MHFRYIKGFTLIELITVIIIAGIISAVAIPKFFDFSGSAASAKVKSVANTFASGVSLVHSSWISEGGSSSVASITSETGQIIGVTDEGWPENVQSAGGDGDFTTAECVDLFSGLIKNAPSVAASPDVSKEFTASVSEDYLNCTYTLNSSVGRSFNYNLSNGAVTVVVP
ncbi:MAG: prepilin-type N-terminal cleavage/methylation domain-containing protein [Legionellales bacterium]|nr:prepilin-type N-terminal cleavage/methylation domain-containing protein [Legionellales bacterium]